MAARRGVSKKSGPAGAALLFLTLLPLIAAAEKRMALEIREAEYAIERMALDIKSAQDEAERLSKELDTHRIRAAGGSVPKLSRADSGISAYAELSDILASSGMTAWEIKKGGSGPEGSAVFDIEAEGDYFAVYSILRGLRGGGRMRKLTGLTIIYNEHGVISLSASVAVKLKGASEGGDGAERDGR